MVARDVGYRFTVSILVFYR